MIISDLHKYVFVQIPHTASTTIAKVLVENYDGRHVLRKHSYLDELRFLDRKRFQDYFIFGAVRNPLDERVSIYHKYKSDHLGLYSGNLVDKNALKATKRSQKISRDIISNNWSFQQYFKACVSTQYNSPISICKSRYDLILKYERLQDGFDQFTTALNLDPHVLQKGNRTQGKEKDFAQYYTEDIRLDALKVFGWFMSEFNYSVPEGWPDNVFLKKRIFQQGLRRAMWCGRTLSYLHKTNISELRKG